MPPDHEEAKRQIKDANYDYTTKIFDFDDAFAAHNSCYRVSDEMFTSKKTIKLLFLTGYRGIGKAGMDDQNFLFLRRIYSDRVPIDISVRTEKIRHSLETLRKVPPASSVPPIMMVEENQNAPDASLNQPSERGIVSPTIVMPVDDFQLSRSNPPDVQPTEPLISPTTTMQEDNVQRSKSNEPDDQLMEPAISPTIMMEADNVPPSDLTQQDDSAIMMQEDVVPPSDANPLNKSVPSTGKNIGKKKVGKRVVKTKHKSKVALVEKRTVKPATFSIDK